jgi:GST-like protein
VNIGAGEQFRLDFLKISPNNRVPAMVDHEGPDAKPSAIFESGAMLLYLAEKAGRKFMPQDVRGTLLPFCKDAGCALENPIRLMRDARIGG